MFPKNPLIKNLSVNYLFPEIDKRKQAFLTRYPDRELIDLGIGDTSRPLPQEVVLQLQEEAKMLGTERGYRGYGPSLGLLELRESIALNIYQHKLSAEEITISDGIKPDLTRMSLLFGSGHRVAVQDPTYPVYLETSCLMGDEVIFLKSTPENFFFPDWFSLKGPHILFICSPNNPTGSTLNRHQLEKIVLHANEQGMIIFFDAAYGAFISSHDTPKSIFEIPGAEKCAIEFGSFSKSAGFSGVRLGWCAISKKLLYGQKESLLQDWKRILSTTFNGASILSQKGGIACLTGQGKESYNKILASYQSQAKTLKRTIESHGIRVYGGEDSPFLWVDLRPLPSWTSFDSFIEKPGIITVPGKGFGEGGEGFLRFSGLGGEMDIKKAVDRLNIFLPELKEEMGRGKSADMKTS